MTIELTNTEAEEIFYNSLCNAAGTGWLAGYGLEVDCNEDDYKAAKQKLETPCLEDVWMQVLKDGKELSIVDHENDGEYTKAIKLEDIHNRIKLVPFDVLTNIETGCDDVIDADVVIQTIFFGEVIFG